jgi:hypothetical protein
MTTLNYTETLVVRHCWCGIAHGIPENLSRRADEDGIDVFCPLGHVWVIKDTEIKKLRRKLAAEEAARADEERRRRAAQDLLRAEERSHAATRGHLTRTKKRIGNGVCPCCGRHFTDVERHMASKHPDYAGTPA